MIKSFKINIPKKITDNIYFKVKKYLGKMPILKDGNMDQILNL